MFACNCRFEFSQTEVRYEQEQLPKSHTFRKSCLIHSATFVPSDQPFSSAVLSGTKQG